jgi:hypothetical protein
MELLKVYYDFYWQLFSYSPFLLFLVLAGWGILIKWLDDNEKVE